jgi:hypothetical protein
MEDLAQDGLTLRPDPARRPSFFPGNPDVDRLLAMIAALASEVAVLRARLDTHERLAAGRGVFDRAAVEAYAPPDEIAAERRRDIQAIVARVFGTVREELEALGKDAAAQRSLMERISAAMDVNAR